MIWETLLHFFLIPFLSTFLLFFLSFFIVFAASQILSFDSFTYRRIWEMETHEGQRDDWRTRGRDDEHQS